jgi:hypothetical protein
MNNYSSYRGLYNWSITEPSPFWQREFGGKMPGDGDIFLADDDPPAAETESEVRATT